ncbi:MAG: TolC family protein [Chitinophagales bacterium]
MKNSYLNKILFCCWIFILLNVQKSFAQQMTLNDAIATTLNNNYGLIISGYQRDISTLQNHPGYAGMLPVISAVANYNSELSNTEQKYFSGETRSEQNAGSTLFDAGVYLNYTIFDGLGMFATKERLEELSALGELNLKSEIENVIFSLSASWYQLIQLQNAFSVIDSAIDISKERYRIAENRKNIGAGSGLDLLQAEVDLNTDSSSYFNLELQIKNMKAEINDLMGRDPFTQFTVNEKIVVDPSLQLQNIINAAAENNYDILIAHTNERVVDLQIKEFKALLFPTLDLTAGYGYLKSTSEAGFVESNLSYGPSVGLTLTVPLFNGFTTGRNLDIAKINQQISATNTMSIRSGINTHILTLYNQYQTSLYLIELEKRNVAAAKQNVSIALEKFNLGSMISIELRDIQQKQIDAENRLLLETLNAKLAELELKRLSGK